MAQLFLSDIIRKNLKITYEFIIFVDKLCNIPIMIFFKYVLLFSILFGIHPFVNAKVRISDLTCEYLNNPLCISTDTPRLGWKLAVDESTRPVNQMAYRILVATSPEKLFSGKADLWDSGRVESSTSNQIVYLGIAPKDVKQYFWRVGVWTGDSATH